MAFLIVRRVVIHSFHQDLWILGSMMGISACASKIRFLEMTKDLNRAQARDRRAERQSDDAGDRLRALLSGEDVDQVASSTELAPKLRQWIPKIRDAFAPYVIRRTLNSVDHSGSKIFGLPPYEEHVMLLELRDWEKARLREITSELVDQGPITTLAGAGKVSVVYPCRTHKGVEDALLSQRSLFSHASVLDAPGQHALAFHVTLPPLALWASSTPRWAAHPYIPRDPVLSFTLWASPTPRWQCALASTDPFHVLYPRSCGRRHRRPAHAIHLSLNRSIDHTLFLTTPTALLHRIPPQPPPSTHEPTQQRSQSRTRMLGDTDVPRRLETKSRINET